MTDYDSPWKEALDRSFEAFLAFFFPAVHALINWQRDCEPLDTELRKILPGGAEGKRHLDRLVKAFQKGTDDPRLVHVEVQVTAEQDFERRMHIYNYRIEDAYSHPVLTLVVLGDENPDWLPCEYLYEQAGVRRMLVFPIVKLLQWADRFEQLVQHENPFGLFVLAHLTAQRTRGDIPARKERKLNLLRSLYERKMEAEDLRQWYRYIDWFLDLPADEDRAVWQQIQAIEKEKAMPFITSVERLGYESGYERGLDEGKSKGFDEGKSKGFDEGKSKGFDEGKSKGFDEGQLRGLLEGIQVALEAKHGEAGLALFAEIQSRAEHAFLTQILRTILTATSLDEVRALLR
jgi:hypothetical protein